VSNSAPPSNLSVRIRRALRRAPRRVRVAQARRQDQRVIAILGMHRAGTSSLAGSLEAAGLFLGDVHGRGHWNPKGNRESKVLMRLHEDVLKANGGAWHKPPERVTWSAEHRARRDRYIRRRGERPLWGFKDPRTLLVIDGWLEAIPDLEMVATVRHPMAVARSLQRRSGSGSFEPWLDLWLAYSRRLLVLHEQRGFPIIDFDLPADAYQARLSEIVVLLGLQPLAGDTAFFEPSLRHVEPDPEPLPAEVDRVYLALRAAAARAAGQSTASAVAGGGTQALHKGAGG
jgi:hypothetical protein